MEMLVQHVTEKHGEKLDAVKNEYATTREFLTWKENVEKETTSWFVKYRKREGKHYTIDWFRCNRTGTHKPRGTGKRAMKQQGTSKMDGYCTAYMKVMTSKSDGKVTVEACLGHFGHSLKLGHLRIPDQIRQNIAGKLAKGITIESILDDIRDSTEDGISRGHLIDRKDIINVKHQLNVDLMEKDPKDTRSVHYWVNELEKGEFNPVLIYKPQGVDGYSLPNDDFLLGIQTKYQLDKLKRHGDKIICMDSTHKTNQYDFQLISILVIDEFGEGVPVAWLISNREDQLVLSPFLAAIAARTGAIKTSVFMSDDANNFYNAWVLNFPKPEKKLICAWHVDKNWRKGLRTHISTKDDMAEVYAALKTMQFEENESMFRKQLQEFCAWCEKTYPRFFDYFTDTYVRHVEQWALCFRVGAGINTNMTTEAFHNLLKGLYFQRKQNRRIDHLLCKLLKIARDKVFDGLIKNEKGKRTYKLRATDLRHKRAEEIHDEDILEVESENWKVRSQEDENVMYTIRLMKESCHCHVHCSRCGVCQHMYRCGCTDFNVRGIPCKHIHAVHMRQPNGSEDANLARINAEPMVQDEEAANKEYFQGMLETNAENTVRMFDVDKIRTAIMGKIADLTEIVQNSTSPLALRTAMAHVNSAITVAQGLGRLENEHAYDLKPTNRFPANKNFELQPRFLKTKKQTKKPIKSLSLPTAEERRSVKTKLAEEVPLICAFCFKENDAANNVDVDWVECPQCGLWAHWQCDGEGMSKKNYVCSVCNSA